MSVTPLEQPLPPVPSHQLTVHMGSETVVIAVEHGSNLRQVLLTNGLSPYGKLSRLANCGGRGLCATCGVRVNTENVPPVHWHDRIGNHFGYLRLSCQIHVTEDLDIEILGEKIMWGPRTTR